MLLVDSILRYGKKLEKRIDILKYKQQQKLRKEKKLTVSKIFSKKSKKWI